MRPFLSLSFPASRAEFSGFIRDHHFGELRAAGHPLVLCTDDSGVFRTTLSGEYALAGAAFGLGEAELRLLAAEAVEHCFAEEEVKAALRRRVAL